MDQRTARRQPAPRLRTNLDTDFLKLIAILSMLLDHIGAVFFPEHPAFRWVGRLAIGRDRNTDACPAANYAQIRLTRSDRLRAAFSINRIIHRFLGVRPQIQDLRSSFFQMLLDQFLQREASVV